MLIKQWGGEKMRRFLKKLSSLCFTFALSTSSFLGLSANAASEDIDDCYWTEENAASEDVDECSIKLLFDRRKKGISFDGLNEEEIRAVVNKANAGKMYMKRERCFASLLREIGQEEMADAYKKYRNQFDRIGYYKIYRTYAEKDDILKKIDDFVREMAKDFFIRFRPSSSNPQAVGLYALIYEMSFEEAMEILA